MVESVQMVRPRKFPSVWAERIQRLMWATGEHTIEMGLRFSLSEHQMRSIVNGTKKRFTVNLVRRLQALEAQFSADLQALAGHKIRIVYHGKRWVRYDYRRNNEALRRETLGDVGLSRSPVSGPPPKTVRFSYGARNYTAIYRTDESRRPEVAAGGSAVTRGGVS